MSVTQQTQVQPVKRGGFKAGTQSMANLAGVHPNLIKVVLLALSKYATVDFRVNEGLRSINTQRTYYRQGKSKTMKSKHLKQKDGYGHAVDLYPTVLRDVNNKAEYLPVVKAMMAAAKELNVPIVCGYDWGWDAPHYQLA
jgi:peptidoglycan L-alanyl-D-glutamate endopeptidase CwlK